MKALSLAGGGARGIISVGYLKAYHDLGLDYDTLYTSSVGTLNGLLYHQGELDKLEDLWLNIKTEDVYTFNFFTALNIFSPKACLFDSTPLFKLIKKYIDYDKLISNPRKLIINTSDFTNWGPYSKEIRDLNRNNYYDFIRASASPPIAFEPIMFEGRILVDSGMLNNYAITQAIQDGHDNIVMLSPTVREETPKISNIVDMLNLVTSIPPYGYLDREVKSVISINNIIDKINISLEPDYIKIDLKVVKPDKPTGIELLNFNYKQDRKDLIQYGYDLAKDILLSK